MTTYRIKFQKGEGVRFISHLDVMRYFQRAIKRAGLPIGYSKGFNPHQIMSFASPLTLGTLSLGEYADLEFEKEVLEEELKDRLNSVIHGGFYVDKVKRLPEGAKNCMAQVSASSYTVRLSNNVSVLDLRERLSNFLSQEEIIVRKKTKKSEKDENIKEDILELKDISTDKPILYMVVNSGSKRNLKPESLIKGLYDFLGAEFLRYNISYTRNDIYTYDENNRLVPLI